MRAGRAAGRHQGAEDAESRQDRCGQVAQRLPDQCGGKRCLGVQDDRGQPASLARHAARLCAPGRPIPRPLGGGVPVIPPPPRLKAFPLAERGRPKTRVPGRGLRYRWQDRSRFYEWDYLHGRVEVYDWRGRHLGEFDPETGEQTKPADPQRKDHAFGNLNSRLWSG